MFLLISWIIIVISTIVFFAQLLHWRYQNIREVKKIEEERNKRDEIRF